MAAARFTTVQIVDDQTYDSLMGVEQPVREVPRLDGDGCFTDGGQKIRPISYSRARDFSTYMAENDRAIALGATLQIVSDDYFGPPPSAA